MTDLAEVPAEGRYQVIVWVSLSELTHVRLVHGNGHQFNGWRGHSVRDAFRQWLDGHGDPLPPIVIRRRKCEICRPEISGHHVCGDLKDGHHRLGVAREFNVPIRVSYEIDACLPHPFGWPAAVSPAGLQRSGTDWQKLMNTLSQASAETLRAEILACVARRQRATGAAFEFAARDMFAPHGEVTSQGEVRSLTRATACHWLGRIQHVTEQARRRPADVALAAECIPTLASARAALEELISALEEKR